MKRITALFVVFVMILGMCTMALAVDEEQSTKVTVHVRSASYTVHVPEDVTTDLNTVADATRTRAAEYTPDSDNVIGAVTVTDVLNCNYVFCNIQAPRLISRNSSLSYTMAVHSFSAESICDDVWVQLSPGESTDCALYCAGRQTRNMSQTNPLIPAEYGPAYLLLEITPEQAAAAVPGDYTGSVRFEFSSYNQLPSD